MMADKTKLYWPDFFDATATGYQISPAYIPNDTYFGTQWHLNDTSGFDADINVTSVWDDYTGNGVVVGIIDTAAARARRKSECGKSWIR